MFLSTTQKRINTCRFVSRYELLERYVGQEVMRTMDTSGISYSGIEERDFDTLVEMFVPAHIRRSHVLGLDIGEYGAGSYILHVIAGVEHALSRKLLLTRNSPF